MELPVRRLASLDLETCCGVPTCPGYRKGAADQDQQEGKCKHAVHHKLNKIDIIGVWDGGRYYNFKDDVAAFDAATQKMNWEFVFHGGKFDYKTLKSKGSAIDLSRYVGDTNILGAAISRRVSKDYLEWYSEQRSILNEQLPKGSGKHRPGSPLSLKTMAPFYLGVEPFWENPATHDDPEYNKTDCIHTLDLHDYLLQEAEREGTIGYYYEFQLPWLKLIIEAELEGILIDEKLLHTMYAEAQKELAKIEAEVHETIEPCFREYRERQIAQLKTDSMVKCDNYIQKRVKNPAKHRAVRERYFSSLEAKIQKLPTTFNLASNPQMLHILKWAGIDTEIEKRDKATNEWLAKEGADKYVLKRAKVKEKNEFAAVLLKYREKETEVGYLKQYIDAVVDGRIYCSFNLTGTRTGRLSSSGPNLQNIKGALRKPFIFADPDKYDIYPVDASQIEPRLIAYKTAAPELVKLFQDGRDYHNYATHLFFEETRSTPENEIKKKFPHLRNDVAKHGDLSLLYGTGKFTLQTMILTRAEKWFELDHCGKWCDDFKAGNKTILAWKMGLEEHYKKTHRLYNDFGAPVVPGSSLFMTLFNGLIQGEASQRIFHASLMAYRDLRFKRKIDVKPLTWVHDEVIWRFPKEHSQLCKKVVDFYMTCYRLDTPYGRVPMKCEGHLGNAKNGDVWVK